MASRLDGASQNGFAPAPAAVRIAALIDREQQSWALFAPVMLGAGIAAWFGLPWVTDRQIALLFGLAVAASALLVEGVPRRLLLSGGLLFVTGLVAADLRSQIVAAPALHHRLPAADVEGEVLAVELRSGGDTARVLIRRPAREIDPASTVRLSFAHRPPDFVREGALVRVRAALGPLPPAAWPGGYDPGRRGWFQAIAAAGRASGEPVLVRAAPDDRAPLARLRARIASGLQRLVPGDAGAVAVTLAVGEQGRVSDGVLDAMRVAGMAHLLTISGLHVAVVAAGAGYLVRMLAAFVPWLALRLSPMRVGAICGGLAAVFYVLLAGAEVPAVRSAIAVWVVIAAMLLGRDVVSLRLLAFAAFVILAARPELLLDAGFQLSFGAVGALLVLARSALGRWLRRPAAGEAPLRRLLRLCAGMLATGVAAELVLTPIALAQFGRSGVYGVVANLVAIPWTSFVVMPLEALFLAALPLGAAAAVAPLLGWSIDVLIALAMLVSAWPGAAVAVPAVPAVAFGIGVAGVLLLALLSGPLRWTGAPLVVLAVAAAVLARPPDLLVAPDGRQIGVAAADGLYLLRGQRGGFVARTWSEAVRKPIAGRISDLPGARCDTSGCRFVAGGGLRVFAGDHGPAGGCAAFDLVVVPGGPGGSCRPRWMALDRSDLARSGAVAIWSRGPAIVSVGARAGDHPWSPAASPGTAVDLLGRRRWIGVLSQ